MPKNKSPYITLYHPLESSKKRAVFPNFPVFSCFFITSMSKGTGYNHCASARDGSGGTTAVFSRTRRVPFGAKGSLRGRKVTVPLLFTQPPSFASWGQMGPKAFTNLQRDKNVIEMSEENVGINKMKSLGDLLKQFTLYSCEQWIVHVRDGGWSTSHLNPISKHTMLYGQM